MVDTYSNEKIVGFVDYATLAETTVAYCIVFTDKQMLGISYLPAPGKVPVIGDLNLLTKEFLLEATVNLPYDKVKSVKLRKNKSGDNYVLIFDLSFFSATVFEFNADLLEPLKAIIQKTALAGKLKP